MDVISLLLSQLDLISCTNIHFQSTLQTVAPSVTLQPFVRSSLYRPGLKDYWNYPLSESPGQVCFPFHSGVRSHIWRSADDINTNTSTFHRSSARTSVLRSVWINTGHRNTLKHHLVMKLHRVYNRRCVFVVWIAAELVIKHVRARHRLVKYVS